MSEQPRSLMLVRLSPELTTKARGTRKRFTRQLASNVRDALRTTGLPFRVKVDWTRLFVRTDAPDAAGIVCRVPGVSSVSEVIAECPADLDAIVSTGAAHFAGRVCGRTYAVRARRTGTHPFSSGDVQRRLGAALNPGARVDLTHPEVEVEVEIRDERAIFFSGRREGLGGLPLAVEGRAVCLISGGFDSGAAAWLMLKRGLQLDYVFCNLAGDAYERSVIQVTKVLADRWSYGTRPRLHVVDFGPPVDELRRSTAPRYWQLVLKRMMYRAAERIAQRTDAGAIVTGESIGQVSSQTLANLRAIDDAATLPVFRPLLGFDKREIVDLTRRIGTYDLSAAVKEYCGIAPGHPATRAVTAVVAQEDAKMDPSVLDAAIEQSRELDVRALNQADLVEGYLFTDDVPPGAVVIDVRSEDEWRAWHYPGARRYDAWGLEDELRGADDAFTYVLYCDQGMQAAFLAEALQRRGLEAYAFRGGTAALRERAGVENGPGASGG